MEKRRNVWKKALFAILAALLVLAVAFFVYTGIYYHADETAAEAVKGNSEVSVRQVGDGLLFDGAGETDLFVFYPGAKVEYTAYAPLMLELAENGLDCVIIKMPYNLAFFGVNRAERYLSEHTYDRIYLGGHSLGGAMAASYASKHLSELDGLILLASYPTNSLASDSFSVLSIYGSEDGVLNMEKLAEGEQYMPKNYVSDCIEGGNHAQFGSYGEQSGDGTATIDAETQRTLTAEAILRFARLK